MLPYEALHVYSVGGGAGFSGMEWQTGMLEWNGGMEWCNRMLALVAYRLVYINLRIRSSV